MINHLILYAINRAIATRSATLGIMNSVLVFTSTKFMCSPQRCPSMFYLNLLIDASLMRVINVQFDFVNGTLYLYVVHSPILVSHTHLAFSVIPMSANTHSESCLSLLYQSPRKWQPAVSSLCDLRRQHVTTPHQPHANFSLWYLFKFSP